MAGAAERIDPEEAGEPGDLHPKKSSAVWRFGHAFKDDKLYVFESRRVLVAKAWPDLRAWYRTPCRPWMHDRKWADQLVGRRLFICGAPVQLDPLTEPLTPENEWQRYYWNRKQEEEHAALSRFTEQIPADVRTEALRFGNRIWHILSLFSRCPGALDLSVSNPALAFALASNWVFHKPAVKQPLRAARSLVRKKQRHILEWLGFPCTESVRRIFAKLDQKTVSTGQLLTIRLAIQRDPKFLKTLSHLPRLDAAVVQLAGHPDMSLCVTPKLLQEVAAARGLPENGISAIDLMNDSFRMKRQLHEELPSHRFHSLAGLRDYHDTLGRRFRQEEWESFRRPLPDRFPDPPFPGNDSIVPLLTPEALREEGIAMDHCVASYAREAASGAICIYRVTAPVRATMAIRNIGNGRWEKQEVRGYSNAAIDPQTQQSLFDELFRSRGPR